MKIIGCIIGFCILSLCICDWELPFPIFETSNEIIAQTTYIETSTGKMHIVFIVKFKDIPTVMYTSVAQDGTVSKAVVLSLYPADTVAASITGANDGVRIYIVMTLIRDGKKDIFFTETTTGGLYWSNPIICRSNDIDDLIERHTTSMVLSKFGVLHVFYWKNQRLHFVTRVAGSAYWGVEIDIHQAICSPDADSSLDSAYIQRDNDYVLIYQFVCKAYDDKYYTIVGESFNGGVTWTDHFLTKYKFARSFRSTMTDTSGNGKLYQGLLQNDTDWERAAILEYSIGGYWRDMLSLPRISLEWQTINVCKIKEKTGAIYFAAAKKYRTEDDAMLLQFQIDEPWKIKYLPVPITDFLSTAYDVNCNGDSLIMTAVAQQKGLYGLRYVFTTSKAFE